MFQPRDLANAASAIDVFVAAVKAAWEKEAESLSKSVKYKDKKVANDMIKAKTRENELCGKVIPAEIPSQFYGIISAKAVQARAVALQKVFETVNK